MAMNNDVFTAPDVTTWHMAKKFSTYDFYKPVKALFDTVAYLSQCTIQLKSGEKVLQTLQKHLVTFDQTVSAMKALVFSFYVAVSKLFPHVTCLSFKSLDLNLDSTTQYNTTMQQ